MNNLLHWGLRDQPEDLDSPQVIEPMMGREINLQGNRKHWRSWSTIAGAISRAYTPPATFIGIVSDALLTLSCASTFLLTCNLLWKWVGAGLAVGVFTTCLVVYAGTWGILAVANSKGWRINLFWRILLILIATFIVGL